MKNQALAKSLLRSVGLGTTTAIAVSRHHSDEEHSASLWKPNDFLSERAYFRFQTHAWLCRAKRVKTHQRMLGQNGEAKITSDNGSYHAKVVVQFETAAGLVDLNSDLAGAWASLLGRHD